MGCWCSDFRHRREGSLRAYFFATFLLLMNAQLVIGAVPKQQDVLLLLSTNWVWSTKSTWKQGLDCSSGWDGVKCDSVGNVVYLYLGGKGISGPITDTICGLVHLRKIRLDSNKFTGSIPSCIGSMKALDSLYFAYNKMTGDIPTSICNLVFLVDLYLDYNQFTGSLHPCLGNLVRLKKFSMVSNNLTGVIPNTLCQLKYAQDFMLSYNKLSGPIPPCIGNLSSINRLYLAGNFLNGTIPDSLGNCATVTILYMNNNKLVGGIPSTFALLNKLEKLILGSNYLSGTVPTFLQQKKMAYLDLRNNYFTGDFVSNATTIFSAANCLRGNKYQRPQYDCDWFCHVNAPTGACNGYGTCILDANGDPACQCVPGRIPPDCTSNVEIMPPPNSPPPPSPPPPSPPPPSPPPPPPSSPPPPPPKIINPPPPPPVEDQWVTWLSAPPSPTKYLNPYFRYAAYRYTGTQNSPNWDLTASIDWRPYYIAPVEDQQDCNACWAIAPASAVESLLSITNVGLKVISKQQILDCQGYNKSCGGGWPSDALEYLSYNGVALDLNYPYANTNQKCLAKNSSLYKTVKIAMYEEVDFYGSFGLILAVQNQPVIINIQSSEPVFQLYDSNSGIMDSESCFTEMVDHTVLLMGYTLFEGLKPYWIIRNSWGRSWGIDGYMKLAYTGGLGICGIHSTPALYPILSFKLMSANAVGNSPCGTPNPCGQGICSIDKKTKLNKCSKCPPSFIVVKNLDGTQSCAPTIICSRMLSNPCGVGTCVDDMKGGYTCICPIGYVRTNYSDVNLMTCTEASKVNLAMLYTVDFGVTCPAIYTSFGLSKSQFVLQNKKVDCDNLVPGITVVNVTQSQQWKGCAVKYSWNYGDSCRSIASLLGISTNELNSLNPDLDCMSISPGTQICVKAGQPPERTPSCGKYHALSIEDTCASIVKTYSLNPFSFLLYNPGINCKSLLPKTTASLSGQLICVDEAEPYGRARSKCRRQTYYVRKYDTCPSIIVKYFRRSYKKFKQENHGLNCFGRRFKVGQRICY